MILTKLTLLTEAEFEKYAELISVTKESLFWWLKPEKCFSQETFVSVVYGSAYMSGERYNLTYYPVSCSNCYIEDGGVRPVGVFEIETSDNVFWSKSDLLEGTKICYGKYSWMILYVCSGYAFALCDDIIARRPLNRRWYSAIPDEPISFLWDRVELKRWLETEGMRLITS
jgi:hypothetical protein